MPTTDDPVLSEPQAAAYTGLASRTLQRKRLAGEIAYLQLSERRVGYRRSQLDEYLNQRTIDAASLAAKTRAAQGLPPTVEDPDVLENIGQALARNSAGQRGVA